MKRTLLLSVLAIAAAVAPPPAQSQVMPEKPTGQAAGPEYKYEAFVGWGYTSLNQVSQSRSGLQGVSASVARGFGEHFALEAQGGHYAWSVTSSNPGNPSVDLFLAGPVLRAPLYEKFSGFVHAMIGGAHTGGIAIQPNVSFAGGLGVGMDYNKSERWAIRLYGDDIASSFTLTPYQTGYSPHKRWNARAGIGVVYHF